MARSSAREIEPRDAAPCAEGGGSPLSGVATLAEALSAPEIASEAEAAQERIEGGRFFVACVGQFKRGKSTLLNALVGRPLLPSGVTPVTSVVTVLRHGEAVAARVRLAAEGWREVPPERLTDYVSEERNPENRLGVVGAEVFVPSPLLASGMCLVDTPGIGSVFEGNSRATRDFVPHVDAALVVLGADPPISGDELALVADVARQVPELVFVLNKSDRLSQADREEASRFAQRILAERIGRPIPPLLEVSAAERLAGGGPERAWPALERALERLAHEAGADLLRASEQREVRRLADRLLAEIEEQRGALVRPVEESERRIEDLSASLAEAERALGDLGYLLQAEVDRLSRALEADRDRFLAEVFPPARERLLAVVRAAPGKPSREAAIDAARGIARARTEEWLQKELPAAERLYRAVADRFLDLANDFLARFLRAGDPGLASLPPALEGESGFRERSRFYVSDQLLASAPDPLAWLTSRVLSAERVRRSVEEAAVGILEGLLAANSSRLLDDLAHRVSDSRRKLEGEIRRRLSEALESAKGALERARSRKAAGEESVRAELARLEALRRSAAALRKQAR